MLFVKSISGLFVASGIFGSVVKGFDDTVLKSYDRSLNPRYAHKFFERTMSWAVSVVPEGGFGYTWLLPFIKVNV